MQASRPGSKPQPGTVATRSSPPCASLCCLHHIVLLGWWLQLAIHTSTDLHQTTTRPVDTFNLARVARRRNTTCTLLWPRDAMQQSVAQAPRAWRRGAHLHAPATSCPRPCPSSRCQRWVPSKDTGGREGGNENCPVPSTEGYSMARAVRTALNNVATVATMLLLQGALSSRCVALPGSLGLDRLVLVDHRPVGPAAGAPDVLPPRHHVYVVRM